MKHICVTAIILFIALVAIGCKSGVLRYDVAGTWPGQVNYSDSALETARMAAKVSIGREFTKEEILAALTASPTQLIINEDKTFFMNYGPMPIEGKWTVKDMVITLNVEKVARTSPDKSSKMRAPWALTLSNDKKNLTGTSPTDSGTTIKFERAK